MARVLVVEDDDGIAGPLVRALERDGYEARRAATAAAALVAVVDDDVDLVVLDLGLPDVDGISLCRTLRQLDATLPILMLTARTEEADVIVGLDAGADDYVVKPFRLGELLARVRARVRVRSNSVVKVGDIAVDVPARRAWKGDDELELTVKE